MTRILHVGCYGVPKIAIPGALPPLDAPAPETTWRDTLCSWMKRIRAAGFDCVVPEVRTPAMVDAWLGVVGQAARDAGLRFGGSWQAHDYESLGGSQWCLPPNYGRDTSHPGLRATVASFCDSLEIEDGYEVEQMSCVLTNGPINRLLQTFGGPLVLNMESFFGVCKDFPPVWGTIIGEKLGRWLVSMANDGYVVYWYHPDGDQASSSKFEKAAYKACHAVTDHHPLLQYCRTAGSAQNHDATFHNHAAAHRYGVTTAQWRAMDNSRDRILSVGFDVLDKVLKDMGV